MKLKNKKTLSPLAAKVLIYALFACLCHACAVYFFALHNPYALTQTLLIHTATYMLEHTLMSILLSLIGTFLLQITLYEKSE